MGTPIIGDIWTRRGISILWDAETLAGLCTPSQVVSLRQFQQFHNANWPEDSMSLIKDKALIVAGLEGTIDALVPAEAEEWLGGPIYKALIDFEREVSYGGQEAALILWLADERRLHYHTSDDTYYWYCSTTYSGQQIPLSRCLFKGSQHGLRPIHVPGDKKTERCIGLFHPRISA